AGQARERHRRPHERQHLPPVEAGFDRHAELAGEVLAEVLGAGDLLEAPPVLPSPELLELRPDRRDVDLVRLIHKSQIQNPKFIGGTSYSWSARTGGETRNPPRAPRRPREVFPPARSPS